MRVTWLTDLHLNFVKPRTLESLIGDVRDANPDAVLVGGDSGEAPDVIAFLRRLADALGVPVYFVLGNHDFYRGSIAKVRADAARLGAPLSWLPAAGVVSLTKRMALVGHDGWGDGGFGNATTTPIALNDFWLIEELRDLSHEALLAQLRHLGQEAADHFHAVLPVALQSHDEVIALTHVPPFREACWHEGRISDDDWLPFFASRAVGEALREVMAAHPHRRLTVLCGHTHGAGECTILPNLTVLTGGAVYGKPAVQRTLTVD